MARLVVGCGYLGCRVADRWRGEGHDVYVLTRTESRARHLENRGFLPLRGDVASATSLPPIPAVETLLWSVGFDRAAGRQMADVGVHGLGSLLTVLPPTVRRVIYSSSTGVYGQTDGSWVDESSECRPRRAGGRVCLAAETLLRASRWADRTIVLRLAGIYGPGRLPRLGQLKAGTPLAVSADAVINLIHVDDAADVIVRVANAGADLPGILVVADGQPVRRRVFYEELARLFAVPRPRFSKVEAGAAGSARQGGHKRVANRLLLEKLRFTLQYPSYRDGLSAIARQHD